MDPNMLFTQVTSGAAMAYLLRLIQKWEKLPWITQHTGGITVTFRLILSAAATLGITWQWSASEHGHILAIAFPTAGALLHGLWLWFGQYAMQHGWGQLFNVGTVSSIEVPVELKQIPPTHQS